MVHDEVKSVLVPFGCFHLCLGLSDWVVLDADFVFKQHGGDGKVVTLDAVLGLSERVDFGQSLGAVIFDEGLTCVFG